jgi:peptidyl-prolyl cis-trans isomerase SurA
MKNIFSIKKIILILLILFLNNKNLYAIENKIIVRVNNEIVTSIDIFNEINYLKLLNPQIQELNNEKLFEISKNSLIREKIKKIYLLKLIDEISIEEKYLNNLIKNIYSQKNIKSLQDYKLYLKNNNLNYHYLKNKITIESLWNEMIFQKFNSKVKINKDQIKKEILSNPEENLLLSEILVAKSKDNQMKLKFNQIREDIKKVGFGNAASIHSISETASRGGKIGWIDKNSLNKLLANKLSKLNIGDYTDPILTPSGYLIVKLENKKDSEESEENIEKKIERLVKIKTNQQLNQFSNIYLNKLKKDVVINEV